MNEGNGRACITFVGTSEYEEKTVNTEYCYDRENKNLLASFSDEGEIVKYVYGNGLISSYTSGDDSAEEPAVSYYLYDLRGSAEHVTDDEGDIVSTYAYSSYGQRTVESGTETPVGYCGRDGVLTEDNGLLYMRARYYAPSLRRFVNQDIVVGDISNSNSLNRYSYVEGNPVTMVDPFGLCAQRIENAVDGTFNLFKGGTEVAMGATAIKGGIVVMVTGGPIGWIVGGGLAIFGLFETGFGLSNIYEGTQDVCYAVRNVECEGYNYVRDGVFNGDRCAYESVEYILPTIIQVGGDLGQIYVSNRSSVLSTSATNVSSETSSRKTDFYVTPSGDVVPATGYRYISENAPYLDDMSKSMTIPANANGTYFSFNNYDVANPGALQVPHDASIKVSFDTLQIIDDISIPYGNWGKASYLEPLTKDFPQFGLGGATQVITHSVINITNIEKLEKN